MIGRIQDVDEVTKYNEGKQARQPGVFVVLCGFHDTLTFKALVYSFCTILFSFF